MRPPRLKKPQREIDAREVASKVTRYRKRWVVPSSAQFRDWMKQERESMVPMCSQAQLGRLTHIGRMTISRVERGLRPISLDEANRIWTIIASLQRHGEFLDRRCREIMKRWKRIP